MNFVLVLMFFNASLALYTNFSLKAFKYVQRQKHVTICIYLKNSILCWRENKYVKKTQWYYLHLNANT